MKYFKAFLVWLIIVPIAILNGGLREYVLSGLGAIAMPLSGIILSICIFIIAYLSIPKIKNCNKLDYIIFGIIWFILTNLFDYIMIIKSGKGISQLISQYDFTNGNLWTLVVISTLVAPWCSYLMMSRKK
ncbi:MAG: hypothetical protein KBA74_03280 [Prevotella sp.]|nr:hypothetical protein [Prevotella sp.]